MPRRIRVWSGTAWEKPSNMEVAIAAPYWSSRSIYNTRAKYWTGTQWLPFDFDGDTPTGNLVPFVDCECGMYMGTPNVYTGNYITNITASFVSQLFNGNRQILVKVYQNGVAVIDDRYASLAGTATAARRTIAIPITPAMGSSWYMTLQNVDYLGNLSPLFTTATYVFSTTGVFCPAGVPC